MTRFAAAATLTMAPLTLIVGACSQGQTAEPVEQIEMVPAVELLAAGDLSAKLAAGEAIVIDVRTPAEFAEARLPGALNAPLSTFDPASIPFVEGRETILYCRSSRRSGEAATMLAEHIGGTVRHLEGGILAWQEAGLSTLAQPPES